MHLLLDTHVYLWWLNEDPALTKRAITMIQEAEEVYISSASIWESVIKVQLNKLDVKIGMLVDAIKKEGFIELPIAMHHAAMISKLPNHHHDPFDRILIAQAISEPLRLLTVDSKLKDYSELVEVV